MIDADQGGAMRQAKKTMFRLAPVVMLVITVAAPYKWN
jgi:hypothetical protein